MRIKQVGNKKESAAGNFVSDEATITILAGSPVYLKPDGTVPGLSAVSADSIAAARQPFFFGLAIADTAPLGLSEAVVYGMFDYARIVLTSRSATSATWASYAALAIGDIMSVVTAAGVQALSQSGAGSASVQGWDVVLGSTYPSQTTQASSLGVAASQYWTTTTRVFIRRL